MRGWEAQRARQQKAQAERETAARAADEAAYAEMVSLAMRFADEGHNRDVLFGVLLGRRCEALRAAQIADSVSALQASRREAQRAQAAAEAAANAAEAPDVAATAQPQATDDAAVRRGTPSDPANHGTSRKREENAGDAHPAGVLGGLWFQFLNGLRF